MKQDFIKPPDQPHGTKVISELIEGSGLFESRGYSTVKVTKNGVEKEIRLPIRSTGVAEFQEELSGKAPRPPVTREVIKKNSKEGRELGLPHDTIHIIYDNTDEAYIDALEKHNEWFSWQIAVFALDLTWKKKDGTGADTYEEKKNILQTNGITGSQINRIYKDVQALTQFEEDRQDFLSGS